MDGRGKSDDRANWCNGVRVPIFEIKRNDRWGRDYCPSHLRRKCQNLGELELTAWNGGVVALQRILSDEEKRGPAEASGPARENESVLKRDRGDVSRAHSDWFSELVWAKGSSGARSNGMELIANRLEVVESGLELAVQGRRTEVQSFGTALWEEGYRG